MYTRRNKQRTRQSEKRPDNTPWNCLIVDKTHNDRVPATRPTMTVLGRPESHCSWGSVRLQSCLVHYLPPTTPGWVITAAPDTPTLPPLGTPFLSLRPRRLVWLLMPPLLLLPYQQAHPSSYPLSTGIIPHLTCPHLKHLGGLFTAVNHAHHFQAPPSLSPPTVRNNPIFFPRPLCCLRF